MTLNKNEDFKIEFYPSLGIKIRKYNSDKPDEILDIKTNKIIYTCDQGKEVVDVYPNGTLKLHNKVTDRYHLIKLTKDNNNVKVRYLYNNFLAIKTCDSCPRLFLLVYEEKSRGNICLSFLGDENGKLYLEKGIAVPFEFKSKKVPIHNKKNAIEALLTTPAKDTYGNNRDRYIFYCDKKTKPEDLLKPVFKGYTYGEGKYNPKESLLENEFALLYRDNESYTFSGYELACRNGAIQKFNYHQVEELERGENDEYRIYFTSQGYDSSIVKVCKDGTFEEIATANMKWQYYVDENNNSEKAKDNYPYVIYKKEYSDIAFGVMKVVKDENGNHKLVAIDGYEGDNYQSIEITKGQIKGTDCILFTTGEPSTQILLHESTGDKLEYMKITVKDNFVIATNGDGYDVYFAGPNGFKILGENLTSAEVVSNKRFNEQYLIMTAKGETDPKIITRKLKYAKKGNTEL